MICPMLVEKTDWDFLPCSVLIELATERLTQICDYVLTSLAALPDDVLTEELINLWEKENKANSFQPDPGLSCLACPIKSNCCVFK